MPEENQNELDGVGVKAPSGGERVIQPLTASLNKPPELTPGPLPPNTAPVDGQPTTLSTGNSPVGVVPPAGPQATVTVGEFAQPVPAQQTTQVPAPQNPSFNESTVNKKMKLPLLIISIASILFISLLAAYLIIQVPKNVSKKYVKQSQSITHELAAEIKDLQDNNFAQTQNVTSSFEQAKTSLVKHQTDLEETITKTTKLKDQYHKLKSTKYDKTLVAKNDKAFELADNIESKYKSSLKLRAQVFDAYGAIPDSLDSFVTLVNKGGKLSDFIAFSATIKNQANNAVIELGKISIPNRDDQSYYENKLTFVLDTQAAFARLYTYFQANQINKAYAELDSYSKKNAVGISEVKQLTKDYVTKSSIAKDLAEFNKLDL